MQPISLPVTLLMLRRDRGVNRLTFRRMVLLLLFYRLAFPTARHAEDITLPS